MTYLTLAGILAAGVFQGAFTLNDDGQTVTVLENNAPVFVYRYVPGKKPVYVPERYKRACYIHPLYGLDGEVLTQDFPIDHFHHRGIFWAWPDSTLGERKADVWALDGIREVHAAWTAREADDTHAELAVENHWVFDDAPDAPVMKEHVRITVHPAQENHRAIDFDLTFENISKEVFTLRGSGTANKGYGGFCMRPDASRAPFTFTSAQGESPEDALEMATPWADVSFATEAKGETFSGAAIFEHPGNPGYPHPGWIFRHYGFLGQSWPHSEDYVMDPGASFRLRYRLLVHRGKANEAGVEAAFLAYEKESKP